MSDVGTFFLGLLSGVILLGLLLVVVADRMGTGRDLHAECLPKVKAWNLIHSWRDDADLHNQLGEEAELSPILVTAHNSAALARRVCASQLGVVLALHEGP